MHDSARYFGCGFSVPSGLNLARVLVEETALGALRQAQARALTDGQSNVPPEVGPTSAEHLATRALDAKAEGHISAPTIEAVELEGTPSTTSPSSWSQV